MNSHVKIFNNDECDSVMGTLISTDGSRIDKPFLESNLARFEKSLLGICSWLVWNIALLFTIPQYALCMDS